MGCNHDGRSLAPAACDTDCGRTSGNRRGRDYRARTGETVGRGISCDASAARAARRGARARRGGVANPGGKLSQHETYLGDGLYASWDGWQVRLRAPRGRQRSRRFTPTGFVPFARRMDQAVPTIFRRCFFEGDGRPSFGRGDFCVAGNGFTTIRTSSPWNKPRTLLSCGSFLPVKVL
jgi:hypothetical protein